MTTDSQLLNTDSGTSLAQHPFSGDSRVCGEYQGSPDAEGRRQELAWREQDRIGKKITLVEEGEEEEAKEDKEVEYKEILVIESIGEHEIQHKVESLAQVLNNNDKSQDVVIQEALENTTDRISEDGNNGKSYNQQEPVISLQQRSCIEAKKKGELYAQDYSISIGEEKEVIESPRSYSFHRPDGIPSVEPELLQSSKLQISNSKNTQRASFRGASDYFINLSRKIKRPSNHLPEPSFGKGEEEGSFVNRKSAPSEVKEIENDETSNAHQLGRAQFHS
ncbi:hypothetical protein BGZ76_004562 [Entomortierella beljakovae]|nr:hypothetical protein BGZ76_004562 [Entomortierella beljakovae]